jgi:1,4-alpha-glucan branching enzyme
MTWRLVSSTGEIRNHRDHRIRECRIMVVIHGNVAMFRVHRPQASQVNLVGSFNRWETHECRMVRGPTGNWFACLRLADGDHSFRYYADGQWLSDNGEIGSKIPPAGLVSRLCIDSPQ